VRSLFTHGRADLARPHPEAAVERAAEDVFRLVADFVRNLHDWQGRGGQFTLGKLEPQIGEERERRALGVSPEHPHEAKVSTGRAGFTQAAPY
jgi:hypothetical protein